jgi:hypothetical protein
MGLDPFSKAALGSAGIGAIGGALSSNPDVVPESFADGSEIDPRNSLAEAHNAVRNFGGQLTDRFNEGFEFENAFVQQPNVFSGGGLPMPIGMTAFDAENPYLPGGGKSGGGGGPSRFTLDKDALFGKPYNPVGGGGGPPGVGTPPPSIPGAHDHFDDDPDFDETRIKRFDPGTLPPLPPIGRIGGPYGGPPGEQLIDAPPATDPTDSIGPLPPVGGGGKTDATVGLTLTMATTMTTFPTTGAGSIPTFLTPAPWVVSRPESPISGASAP